MVKDRYVKICPKCKYPGVNQDKSTLQQIGTLPTMYICSKCGYSGYAFPEVKLSELEDFEKDVDDKKLRDLKPKKTDQIDATYGKFIIHIFWKITAPLTLIVGILLIFLNPYLGGLFLFAGLFMFYFAYIKKY